MPRIVSLCTKVQSITRKFNDEDHKNARSAVASAAYRAGEKLLCKRTGKVFDYSPRKGIEAAMIFLPMGVANSNHALMDRDTLWNSCELFERNGHYGSRAGCFKKNVTIARETIITIPAEFNSKQRISFCQEIGQYFSDTYGCAVDMASHLPSGSGDQRNYHLHMMWSDRIITAKGIGSKMNVFRQKGQSSLQIKDFRKKVADRLNEICQEAGYDVHVNYLKQDQNEDESANDNQEKQGTQDTASGEDKIQKYFECKKQMKNRQRSEYMALKAEFKQQTKHLFASIFSQYSDAKIFMKEQFSEAIQEKTTMNFLRKAFLFVTGRLAAEQEKQAIEIKDLRKELRQDLEGLKSIFKDAHQVQKAQYKAVFTQKMLEQRERHVEERNKLKLREARTPKRRKTIEGKILKRQEEKRKKIRQEKDILKKQFQTSTYDSVQGMKSAFQKVSHIQEENKDIILRAHNTFSRECTLNCVSLVD